MVIATIITGAFWFLLIALMVFWRRSWVTLLFFPLIITGALWGVGLWSEKAAVIIAVVLHGVLLLMLIGVGVMGRKEGDDPFFKRPPAH